MYQYYRRMVRIQLRSRTSFGQVVCYTIGADVKSDRASSRERVSGNEGCQGYRGRNRTNLVSPRFNDERSELLLLPS
jgi:hypothetical protein